MSRIWHGGKGSRPRRSQVSTKQFDDNWDRIFGKKEPEQTVRGICPTCHEECDAKTNKPTEQFPRGDKITSRHYRQYGSGARYLCDGAHELFLEVDTTEGVKCKSCGGYNTHEEAGTYKVLFPECKHCGECTEG